MKSIDQLSAVDAAKRLAAREISAEQYVRACLDRIDERESEVRAFAFINREGALERAKQLDAGPVLGALHGLTLGIKDVFETYDMPTQGGSKAFEGYRPLRQPYCCHRLFGPTWPRRSGRADCGRTCRARRPRFLPRDRKAARYPHRLPDVREV